VVALDLAVLDAAVVDEVRLEPEDRLDLVLLAGLVELDRAVHHAVVGEPERRLAELGGPLGELLDLARAVEQRVLGVDVEMRAADGHGRGKTRPTVGRPSAFGPEFAGAGAPAPAYTDSTCCGTSISRLRILPVGPFGSSSGNQILRGYL
jgi:hypothetical protein